MATRFEVCDVEAFVQIVQELHEAAEIILLPGTFSLPSAVDLSYPVTLIGAGSDQTVISCGAEGWVVRFLAGLCTVRGIHFAHLGELAANVVIVNAPFDIRDCKFTGGIRGADPFVGVGLGIVGESPGRVIGCEASGNQTGIIATMGSPATLQGNRCFDNRGDGINIYKSTCTLRRNRCERNYDDGICVSDSVVTLTGNDLLENTHRGIHILGSSEVRAEDNSCIGNGAAGIEWRGSSTGKAAGNHVRRNDIGINLLETCGPALENNTVTENIGTGISVQDDSKIVLRKNHVSGNGFAGLQLRHTASALVEENSFNNNAWHGVALFEASRADMRNNSCTSNQSSGILVSDATAELTANVCSHNQGNGARIDANATVTSRSNQFDDNAETGLMVTGDARLDSHGDFCRRNRETGFAVGENSRTTVDGLNSEENQIFGVHFGGAGETACTGVLAASNGSSGFYVVQKRRLRFEKCRARANGVNGYDLQGESHYLTDCVSENNLEFGILANSASELAGSTVSGNGKSGLMVAESVFCTVMDNKITGNQQHGIGFSGDSGGLVRGNHCDNNGLNGISVWGTATPRLIGNHCMDNSGTGITCSDHSKATIEENHLGRNQLGGIALLDDSEVTITSNQISGNSGPGIYAADRSAPLITGNRITHNAGGILADRSAKPRKSGNEEAFNNKPDLKSWTLVGSHNGRHVDYKQFAAAATVAVEPAVFLERAAKSLQRMGWAPASSVMLPHPETGGYLAEFRFKTQSGTVSVTVIGLTDGGAAQLNLSFSDSGIVMWLNQQSEHIVAQTLYGISVELSDLTNQKNPWVCLYGDWSADMSFSDAANQPYHVWSARAH